jgi:hypothetical protein
MFWRVGLAVVVLLSTSAFEGCNSGGGASAKNSFRLQNLKYVAFATGNTCSSVDFRTGGFTDSFDSSQGTYAATKQNSNGNLGTNGNLLNESSLILNGSLSTPSGSSVGPCPPLTAASGNPITPADGFQNIASATYPAPPIPSTTTDNFTMPADIPPGTYGNATGCSGTYHFSAGTYNFNSMDCTSVTTFVVDSGPVILNVGGIGSSGNALNFQSGISINDGGKPSNFQILYSGSAGLNIQSEANPVSAVIYAPNAHLDFQSTGDFFGAMVVKTVTFESSGGLHYDRSLP